MARKRTLALAATKALRDTEAFKRLPAAEQRTLHESLDNIERALAAGDQYVGDPYAQVLETPFDLQRIIGDSPPRSGNGAPPPPQSPSPSPRPQMTEVLGGRVADTLEAVDFPGFVAGLIRGTFQAIVDATIQQLHEYAELIGNLSKSVSQFARENVSMGQARQWLADRHHADLQIILPAPGEEGEPQLEPRPEHYGESPEWLADYGLGSEQLSEELTEGALLAAGRQAQAEARLQNLATLVILGINRIIVNEGHIRARMQFHAAAQDRSSAEIANLAMGQQSGIASRGGGGTVSAMISTAKANLQADAGIKADLMGEVHLQFATESFPLERLADPELLEVITRHARWRPEESESSPPALPAQTPASESNTGGPT